MLVCSGFDAAAQTNRTFSQTTISNMFYTNNIAQSNITALALSNVNYWATNINLASFNSTTNIVVPTSVSTNWVTGWDTIYNTGSVGIVTNIAWCTNAGVYVIGFGTGLLASGVDVLTMELMTNGVRCDTIRINATMAATPINEIGYKQTILYLPANSTVGVRVGNDSAASVTMSSPCFLVNKQH